MHQYEKRMVSVDSQALNNIGNLYLQKGKPKEMVSTFSESIQYYNKAESNKKNGFDKLSLCGLNFYALSKMHPEWASVA